MRAMWCIMYPHTVVPNGAHIAACRIQPNGMPLGRPYIEREVPPLQRRDLTQQLCRFERMQFSRIWVIYLVFVYQSERFWSAQNNKSDFSRSGARSGSSSSSFENAAEKLETQTRNNLWRNLEKLWKTLKKLFEYLVLNLKGRSGFLPKHFPHYHLPKYNSRKISLSTFRNYLKVRTSFTRWNFGAKPLLVD